MTKESLKKLLPNLSDADIETIVSKHEEIVQGHLNNVTTLTTERDGLKQQLEDANTTIKSYKDMDIEGIKSKASEWENKYNTETQALKDQLSSTQYGFAVERATAGIKFTSDSAKKAFVAELTSKKLPLQDNKLLGLEDYIKTYKESDPAAFETEGDKKTPVFARSTENGGKPQSSPFAFNFTGVRSKPTDNNTGGK